MGLFRIDYTGNQNETTSRKTSRLGWIEKQSLGRHGCQISKLGILASSYSWRSINGKDTCSEVNAGKHVSPVDRLASVFSQLRALLRKWGLGLRTAPPPWDDCCANLTWLGLKGDKILEHKRQICRS